MDDIYTKKCSNCNKDLFYKTKKSLKVAISKNQKCYSCANSGINNPSFNKEVSLETREKLRIVNLGKKRSPETIQKHKENYKKGNGLSKLNQICGEDHFNYGRKLDLDHKQKISKSKTGKKLSESHKIAISNSLDGRKHTEETKTKQRKAKVKFITNTNDSIAPRYNLNACKFFESLEKEKGWNGFYAIKNKEFYVSELGYFLDYYEPNLNIIIEYDEALHYNIDGSLKNKDIIRMDQIIKLLNCSFYRYNEKTKELKKYE